MLISVNDPALDSTTVELFDAAWNKIPGMVVWAETDSGEVLSIAQKDNKFSWLDSEFAILELEWKSYPAPLRVVTHEKLQTTSSAARRKEIR